MPFSKGTRFLYQKVRDDSHKLDVLLGLYDSLYHLTKAIIYCNTKRKVKIVTEFMRKEFRTVATVVSRFNIYQCLLMTAFRGLCIFLYFSMEICLETRRKL